ncbi:TerB family tellurite resistance protein [Chitinibacter sp. GC72]|uniref:TerB family tellurite resistance protein n=1 Tax=Chitinibacter sp. GC72 TaxID=1526917 RepID=UPI0012FB218D|nr:TerB family tellurite resistance protein [Chitinibacter sp. GC72]
MTQTEQQAILAITLLAAFCDGDKDSRERDAIKQIAASLGGGGVDLARLYQDVLLKRYGLADAVAALGDASQRQLAFEMAVCVVDADGRQTAAETAFLAELKAALQLGGETASIEAEANAWFAYDTPAAPAAPAIPVGGATPAPALLALPLEADRALDASVLRFAIVCGALELLPQSWATMAIVPLQLKLVHSVGKAYGVELDQGHIREFLAAAGVGLTSQYVEQFGRKLLGGLLGKYVGKTAGKVGGAATGIAFSFATTYALGQLARRYYAGGRKMETAVLKDTFSQLLGPAKDLQAQYLPQIQQQARSLDYGTVMQLVKKGV